MLLNADVKREKCIVFCKGCDRVYPEGKVCEAYQFPQTKWRHYRIEEERDTKGKLIIYHYNPCPLSTNIIHSPKPETVVKGKLNPIKHSKRKR